ncbi:MAG: NAD(P)H-hydrate dehydratase [Coriobacteriales bacterium]|jgi:NAD(P)H-hydrate epimerase|nr:NAD(P)H-hydrate dehydratase [Coriobacteriales bacterium]
MSILLPAIPADAHKYSRGSLLVLGGSERYPGAPVLTALAAARTGAGYVTLAVPEPAAAAARAHLLSIPVVAAPAADGAFAATAWTWIVDNVKHYDAIIVGPGMTVTPGTLALLPALLACAEVPLLLDADALNCLSELLAQEHELAAGAPSGAAYQSPINSESSAVPQLWRFHSLNERHPVILTPHAGELQRLLKAAGCVDECDLASASGVVVVAKGPQTRIIAAGGEHKETLYTAGTPALATAGTGDVLAGIIGSLLAQGLEPFSAAETGVALHGRAGHLAEARLGTRSVMAEDVITAIPEAISQL